MYVAYNIFVMETATPTLETDESLCIHQYTCISCSVRRVKAKPGVQS